MHRPHQCADNRHPRQRLQQFPTAVCRPAYQPQDHRQGGFLPPPHYRQAHTASHAGVDRRQRLQNDLYHRGRDTRQCDHHRQPCLCREPETPHPQAGHGPHQSQYRLFLQLPSPEDRQRRCQYQNHLQRVFPLLCSLGDRQRPAAP